MSMPHRSILHGNIYIKIDKAFFFVVDSKRHFSQMCCYWDVDEAISTSEHPLIVAVFC